MNEIGKTSAVAKQAIGGNMTSVIGNGSALDLGKGLNAGLGKSIEENITGILNSKVMNFDSKSSSLACLSIIETEFSADKLNKPFEAIKVQMIPNQPGGVLRNSK